MSSDKYWVIGETDHYKASGYPQHFFLYNLQTGLINDPLLDHGDTVNNYHIVSYRLFKPKGEQVDCAMDNEKRHHMLRNVVYEFYKEYFNREPENDKVIEQHVAWIISDSGDSFNFKGLGRWIKKKNEAEFKANWVEKKVADNATKVAQEKCNTTIAKTQVEAQKEIDKLQEDHKKSIEEQEALFNDHTTMLENKITELTLQVEKLKSQTDGLTEKVVVESLIINWIKKLFKKE